MERRGGEWDREWTSGRIRTRVLHGRQARMWSGILLAPQCPPQLHIFYMTTYSLYDSILSERLHTLCTTPYSLYDSILSVRLHTLYNSILPVRLHTPRSDY